MTEKVRWPYAHAVALYVGDLVQELTELNRRLGSAMARMDQAVVRQLLQRAAELELMMKAKTPGVLLPPQYPPMSTEARAGRSPRA
jgi:hypothetical protein